jgi:hypothetical protein
VPYASLGDPQSLNLYTYVHNNPVTAVDPDGHFDCSPQSGSFSASAYCSYQKIDAANCGFFCQIQRWWEGYTAKASSATEAAKNGSAPDSSSGTIIVPGGSVDVSAVFQQQVSDLAKGVEILNVTVSPFDAGYGSVLIDLGSGNNKGATLTLAFLLVPDTSVIHHIATNKNSVFTPLFEKLFAKYGLGLQDEANKTVISKVFHYSSHPPDYHQWVLTTLRNATRGLKGEAGAAALRDALRGLEREIHQNPGRLSWP